MILIVSPLVHEATALATLFTQRDWIAQTCNSIADFRRLADKLRLRLVITRQRLTDGTSDEILAYLGKDGPTRVIVLAAADCTPREETRHISLGADHVFRDPIRAEVLLEMVARQQARALASTVAPQPDSQGYRFAGVRVFPHEHRFEHRGTSVRATPKIVELVQILYRNAGAVASYVVLYEELFGRHFSGDTSNCRVLLAKADVVFRQLGVNLRDYITVIPKSGYLYTPEPQNVPSPRTSFEA